MPGGSRPEALVPGMCGSCHAASLYDACMGPLELLGLKRRRRELLATVAGRVIEAGAGTGANLRHMPWHRIEQLALVDLELSPRLLRLPRLLRNGFAHHVAVEMRQESVERLPYPSGLFDAAVSTLLFCSVDNPLLGMQELHRVLAPGGRLYFIEHVLPPCGLLRAPLRALNPLWRRLSNGCNLVRDTAAIIERAGFAFERLERSGAGVLISGVALKV